MTGKNVLRILVRFWLEPYSVILSWESIGRIEEAYAHS